MIAIIGGSGFENFDGFEVTEYLNEKTPYGQTSSGLKKVKINGVECLFLSRHGVSHELLPSEVNYQANIYALKRAGVEVIFSYSAVGSLRKEYKPGDLVIANQYIDRTKGLRQNSYLGSGVVGHVSLAMPTDEKLTQYLFDLSKGLEGESHLGQTYVCIEGPYFSTRAESHWYRQMKGDIIGMTHYPEFALAREAGIAYVPCCYVTDYDCWDNSRAHVTVTEVLEVMKNNNAKGFALLCEIAKNKIEILNLAKDREHGLKSGLMTPLDSMSEAQREKFAILLK